MADLIVTITGSADEHQPGQVEFEFTDADGRLHTFMESAAVVSRPELTAASLYPCVGRLSCQIAEEWGDQSGIDLARIYLHLPGADDMTGYVVLASDLR
jgi:hypothetical protein